MLYLPTQIRVPIGGERVTCRGSKLTNSLGKQQLSTSMFPSASPRGTLRVSGKQNSLFPFGPAIECLVYLGAITVPVVFSFLSNVYSQNNYQGRMKTKGKLSVLSHACVSRLIDTRTSDCINGTGKKFVLQILRVRILRDRSTSSGTCRD